MEGDIVEIGPVRNGKAGANVTGGPTVETHVVDNVTQDIKIGDSSADSRPPAGSDRSGEPVGGVSPVDAYVASPAPECESQCYSLPAAKEPTRHARPEPMPVESASIDRAPRLERARHRIATGYYDSREVKEAIAEKLAEAFRGMTPRQDDTGNDK
jgi:hypothetical protein